MNTYKQSCLLAIASGAAAISRSILPDRVYLIGDEKFEVGEGDECNLWWNDIYLPCAPGLKCVDQGPTSPNANTFEGYGICEDPRELGDLFDMCDTVLAWNGDRLPGCKDDWECREFEWLDISLGRRCQIPRTYVGFQEQCGSNEDTGRFTQCEPGLVCEQAYIGAFCQQERVGLNETCEGFNENTGHPFPRCEDGLVCKSTGMIGIPGAGNTCQLSQPKGLFEQCSSDTDCGTGLECRYAYDFSYVGDAHPGEICQHIFGQEGDHCMEVWQPPCDVGLECREQVFQSGFSLDTCQQLRPQSEEWSDSVMLHVENLSDREVQLYWFDYEGTPTPYGIIQPGETGVQQTFATHPWEARATDGSGVELLIDGMQVYTPGASPTDQHLEITLRY